MLENAIWEREFIAHPQNNFHCLIVDSKIASITNWGR